MTVRTGDGRGTAEQPRIANARELLTAMGGSFGGIATATAVFVIMGTLALSVGQRGREIALLRAIGATPRQIRRMIATETVLVAPLASAAGLLPGVAVARWWFDQLVAKGAIPQGVRLSTGWIPMVSALGAGLLASLLAGWIAARRPSRIRPTRALGEALGEAAVERRPGVIRTVPGVAATAGGVVLASLAAHESGDDAASVALGVVFTLMLATALLGPVLAWLASAVLGLPLRAAGASGSLAAANTRANARRLASVITPIVLVTAFCGTLLCMQSTVTHTAARQIRDGVVADQVVGSGGPDGSGGSGDSAAPGGSSGPGGPGLPAGTAARAERLPGVDAAVGVLRTGALYRASGALNSTTVLAADGSPARLPRVLDLGVEQGSLAALTGDGRTVAVDTLLAGSAHVRVGDRLPLWLGDGSRLRPRVVAVYGRGLGLGQVLLPRAAVAAHAATAYDTQVLVRDRAGASASAVAAGLRGLGVPGLTVTDRAGYRAQADKDLEINAWGNRVMAGVLGGFAAVAAANTLVMTVLGRRREFALLRLTGTTRRQVLGMLRWEAVLTAVAGLGLGGAIAWVTLVPVARGVAGAAPYVSPGFAAALGAGTLVLTLGATVVPAAPLLRRRT